MIISHSLTTGQITFILRVVIQVLSYGGLFLIGIIILSGTPRIASLNTHDVINRVVSKSTVTLSSVKWIVKRLFRRNRDPVPTTGLFLSISLLLVYSVFVSVSDIGFIGFYACTTSGPSLFDFPASVQTDDAAKTLVAANLINGTDPTSVHAHRCDAAEPIMFGINVTERNCTAWRNSTYADPVIFSGMNLTDTDALMPRQLQRYAEYGSLDLSSYFLGTGVQRVPSPVITNGLAVNPHQTGLSIIVGAPQLKSLQKVVIPKTMALEIDVGCMTLGLYSQKDPRLGSGLSADLFSTNGTWRKYSGPDHLHDVVSKTVDNIRQFVLPAFNASSIDEDGVMLSYNISSTSFSAIASVQNSHINDFRPDRMNDNDEFNILSNCTEAIQKQLNLPLPFKTDPIEACSLLGISGSIVTNSKLYQAQSKMVCATSTQINMVSATIEVDASNAVNVDLVRLPSDLHIIEADIWDVTEDNNGTTVYGGYGTLRRFTLSDNATGPSSHFILQNYAYDLSGLTYGPGSSGEVLSSAGSAMLNYDSSSTSGLGVLQEGYNQANFSPSILTKWSGELGASYLLASTAYNGWAARGSEPITVYSTGGHPATCFKPLYALAFVPLFVAAIIVIFWAVFVLTFSLGWSGAQKLEHRYGGMHPYADAIGQKHRITKESILVWAQDPHPHLAVFDGQPMNQNNDDSGSFLDMSENERVAVAD